MAFKRNYGRGRRPTGWKRRGPPLARVRRTWIQSLLLDPCDPQLIPLCVPEEEGVCCTTRWEQVIVDNAVLQSQFSDRARVVRILGDISLFWDIGTAADQDEIYTRLQSAFGDLYVQLIKRPINMSTGLAELPGDIWDTTNVVDAYSESKALKTWWHHWNPLDGFSVHPSEIESVTSGSLPVWAPSLTDCVGNPVGLWGTLATGTGTIGASASPCAPITPPVSPVEIRGGCQQCPAELLGVSSLGFQSTLKAPHSWNFKFDIKKRIALREDEQLNLDFQFRSLAPSFFSNMQMVMFSGGIKTLIQMG